MTGILVHVRVGELFADWLDCNLCWRCASSLELHVPAAALSLHRLDFIIDAVCTG